MEIKKLLTVGIIFLFIGVAVAPSINSVVVKTSINKDYKSVSLTEKSKVSVQFFMLRGVETIEREIPFQDSDYLSKLMDGSDVDAIASELTSLGLVPSSMNSEQLKSLISGEYSKKEFAKYSDKLTRFTSKESSEVKQNFLCTLKGEAHSYMARNLRAELFGFAAFPGMALLILDFWLQFLLPNYPIIIPGIYFGFGPLGVIGLTLIAAVLALQYISDNNPIKLSLLFQDIGLYGIYNGRDAYVNTSGIGGKWSLHGYNVDLHLVGFFGIFVSFFNPNSQYDKLIGSSIYLWAQN